MFFANSVASSSAPYPQCSRRIYLGPCFLSVRLSPHLGPLFSTPELHSLQRSASPPGSVSSQHLPWDCIIAFLFTSNSASALCIASRATRCDCVSPLGGSYCVCVIPGRPSNCFAWYDPHVLDFRPSNILLDTHNENHCDVRDTPEVRVAVRGKKKVPSQKAQRDGATPNRRGASSEFHSEDGVRCWWDRRCDAMNDALSLFCVPTSVSSPSSPSCVCGNPSIS